MADTILVVDDDESVRAVAQLALLAQGYTLLETGTELAGRVQAVTPSTKVLLMSGYQTSDIASSGRPFMAKPFSIDGLARRVRETLDRPSSFARPTTLRSVP